MVLHLKALISGCLDSDVNGDGSNFLGLPYFLKNAILISIAFERVHIFSITTTMQANKNLRTTRFCRNCSAVFAVKPKFLIFHAPTCQFDGFFFLFCKRVFQIFGQDSLINCTVYIFQGSTVLLIDILPTFKDSCAKHSKVLKSFLKRFN